MPIDKLLQSSNAQAALSGAVGGAAGGALISAFTNKKSAKKLLKAGGLVALGGVAWKAFQSYQNKAAATQNTPAATPVPQLSQEQFESAPDNPRVNNLLLEAMIAAAYADGHLTDLEQRRIWQSAVDQGVPPAALAALQDMLNQPKPVAELVSQADDLATKIEVYTASLAVLDSQCAAGRAYLENLGGALELPAPLLQALHESNDISEAG